MSKIKKLNNNQQHKIKADNTALQKNQIQDEMILIKMMMMKKKEKKTQQQHQTMDNDEMIER